MKLSIIVPTLNAASGLKATLDSLAPADELIVVDGGSTDPTRDIARAAGARVVASPPGRGIQLRAGVAAANGEWLLIVHADTLLGPGWRQAVEQHVLEQPFAAGYFRFRLRSRAGAARILEALVWLRCRVLALPYGDQGLLMPRRLHDKVGGFQPIVLMEDVDIVRRIGRRRLFALPASAFTCPSRWERGGWIARSARNLACLLMFRAGVSPDRIARLYP